MAFKTWYNSWKWVDGMVMKNRDFQNEVIAFETWLCS